MTVTPMSPHWPLEHPLELLLEPPEQLAHRRLEPPLACAPPLGPPLKLPPHELLQELLLELLLEPPEALAHCRLEPPLARAPPLGPP